MSLPDGTKEDFLADAAKLIKKGKISDEALGIIALNLTLTSIARSLDDLVVVLCTALKVPHPRDEE